MKRDDASLLAAVLTIFIVSAVITCIYWPHHGIGISLTGNSAFNYNPVNTIMGSVAFMFAVFFTLVGAYLIYDGLFHLFYKGGPE